MLAKENSLKSVPLHWRFGGRPQSISVGMVRDANHDAASYLSTLQD
jgi:hypothetical protein